MLAHGFGGGWITCEFSDGQAALGVRLAGLDCLEQAERDAGVLSRVGVEAAQSHSSVVLSPALSS